MAMMGSTGEMFSFRAMAMPTGASISTVATLSTKADTSPAKRASTMISRFTLGMAFTRWSLSRSGILERMKRSTVPMVPQSIIRTFQSTAARASPAGTMPMPTNSAAAATGAIQRPLGSSKSRA